MDVSNVDELVILPVESVLRHPKLSVLVEVRSSPFDGSPLVRIGGHLQTLDSLSAWDFPMRILYRPDWSEQKEED